MGTWQGVAVENLPEGSEMLGGDTVIEQVARGMTLEIADGQLTITQEHTGDRKVETFTHEKVAPHRLRLRYAEEDLLFEVMDRATLRASFVEIQPFVFKRQGSSGEAACDELRYPKNPKLGMRGVWYFHAARTPDGKTFGVNAPRAEVFKGMQLSIERGEIEMSFQGQVATWPYRVSNDEGERAVVLTEASSFGGHFGNEVSVALHQVDKATLEMTTNQMTFIMKSSLKAAAVAPAPRHTGRQKEKSARPNEREQEAIASLKTQQRRSLPNALKPKNPASRLRGHWQLRKIEARDPKEGYSNPTDEMKARYREGAAKAAIDYQGYELYVGEESIGRIFNGQRSIASGRVVRENDMFTELKMEGNLRLPQRINWVDANAVRFLAEGGKVNVILERTAAGPLQVEEWLANPRLRGTWAFHKARGRKLDPDKNWAKGSFERRDQKAKEATREFLGLKLVFSPGEFEVKHPQWADRREYKLVSESPEDVWFALEGPFLQHRRDIKRRTSFTFIDDETVWLRADGYSGMVEVVLKKIDGKKPLSARHDPPGALGEAKPPATPAVREDLLRPTAPRVPSKVVCDAGSELRGAAPPAGNEHWCEKRLPNGRQVKHGWYMAWHTNGVKSEVGRYKDGKLDGTWLRYHKSGPLAVQAEFRDDLQHGVMVRFDAGGTETERLNFQAGELQR